VDGHPVEFTVSNGYATVNGGATATARTGGQGYAVAYLTPVSTGGPEKLTATLTITLPDGTTASTQESFEFEVVRTP
jgi:hypothetical protein